MTKVRGLIRLPLDAGLPPTTVVRVKLLDVSAADAPAKIVDEAVIDASKWVSGGEPLTFALDAAGATNAGSLVVGVHVDRSGDGTLAPGDYIQRQSYPATAGGGPITVDLRKI